MFSCIPCSPCCKSLISFPRLHFYQIKITHVFLNAVFKSVKAVYVGAAVIKARFRSVLARLVAPHSGFNRLNRMHALMPDVETLKAVRKVKEAYAVNYGTLQAVRNIAHTRSLIALLDELFRTVASCPCYSVFSFIPDYELLEVGNYALGALVVRVVHFINEQSAQLTAFIAVEHCAGVCRCRAGAAYIRADVCKKRFEMFRQFIHDAPFCTLHIVHERRETGSLCTDTQAEYVALKEYSSVLLSQLRLAFRADCRIVIKREVVPPVAGKILLLVLVYVIFVNPVARSFWVERPEVAPVLTCNASVPCLIHKCLVVLVYFVRIPSAYAQAGYYALCIRSARSAVVDVLAAERYVFAPVLICPECQHSAADVLQAVFLCYAVM